MVELGKLEQRHADFDKRNVRIFAISSDKADLSKLTQEKFPHLTVVSDADMKLANAVQVVHPKAGIHGEDINAPTTFLVDGAGKVRWNFRAERFMERLPPDALLAAIDKEFP
jgi:peroxiredoxin